MRGHLQQRGKDSWRCKVFLGRSADDQRRYLERTVPGSRSDAEQQLAQLVVEAVEGRWVPTEPMTMAELVDRWLRVKETTVEPSTVANYRWICPAVRACRRSVNGRWRRSRRWSSTSSTPDDAMALGTRSGDPGSPTVFGDEGRLNAGDTVRLQRAVVI